MTNNTYKLYMYYIIGHFYNMYYECKVINKMCKWNIYIYNIIRNMYCISPSMFYIDTSVPNKYLCTYV